ncbi:TonB-dependent receptor plug domain-containing protein [Vibrio sp. SM6]|uniref:TonB-dependent receptor plug domain-containing protein n=1 Tax=Vibrio agarilyticus TaxID=2726741 RepID=A0A7X8TNR6_9VIBR|nr:TonB-dependent receptor plug domain-containing protein [Vibrio agarilyticus]NLS12004.1 TonB-dependent receptor plug domain-containing protein [Vibrio agarilyticus]
MKHHFKFSPLAIGLCTILYGPAAFAELRLEQESHDTHQNAKNEPEVVTVMGAVVTLDRSEIEELPKDNPTLSDLLKHQPRVGVDEAQTAMQGGNLAPEEISLSGARPHQTKYTLNGVGINNTTTFGDGSDLPNELASGHTSGYFLDTNLLDSVEVLDHNISAEYGGFTGGIIAAELRKPSKAFKIDYNFRMNDSDWNASQKVGENFQDDYGTPIDGSGIYQPNYQKQMHALHLSGAISETQSLALNVSHQNSAIPLHTGRDVDQRMDNLFLTHIWHSGDWKTTSDLRYADHQQHRFLNDSLNDDAAQTLSETVSKHSGVGGSVELERQWDFGRWVNRVSYDELDDEREADSDYFATVMKKIDGVLYKHNEGSYGDLKQIQDTWQLSSAFFAEPVAIGSSRHGLKFGVDWSDATAKLNRPNDVAVYQYLEMTPGNPSISKLTRYEAGNYDASAQQYGFFAEDRIDWQAFQFNVGARVDHLDAFEETVFSPRMSASWFLGARDTNNVITLGANRYYSSNLLGVALKAEKMRSQVNYKNCTPNDGDWSNIDESNLTCSSQESFASLDLTNGRVPYSDELSLGWEVDVQNFALRSLYLYRMQRDGISYSADADEQTATVHNNIESDNHIVSFDVGTITPYAVANGHFHAFWTIAYNHRRGTGDLKSGYDDGSDPSGGFQDEWVIVDGELTRYSEMDVSGYQSPVKSSLDLLMSWPQHGLVWNNRINYQQGKKVTTYKNMETVEIDGEPVKVNSLLTKTLGDLATWDMALNWTPSQFKDHVTLGASITNVLNTQKIISVSGVDAASEEHYNSGRQIWLNVSLRN